MVTLLLKWTIENQFVSFLKKGVLPPFPVSACFILKILQNGLEENYKQHFHYTKDNRCKPDRGIFISLQPSVEKILFERKPIHGKLTLVKIPLGILPS